MLRGYKAFKADMTCRGKQYESYKIYEENGHEICESGVMHFCETPLDCFNYYPILNEQAKPYAFAHVKALGDIFGYGSKRATQKLYIGRKISLRYFVKIGLDKLSEKIIQWSAVLTHYGRCVYKPTNDTAYAEITKHRIDTSFGPVTHACIGISGVDNRISTSSDDVTIASTGGRNCIAASSSKSRIVSTGCNARITTTGGRSKIAALGEDSQIVSTNSLSQYYASGDESIVCCTGSNAVIRMEGKRSIGVATGCFSRVSGKIGDWIVLTEWNSYQKAPGKECKWMPVCVKAVQIDGKILKPDVLYCLKNGNIIEFDEEEGVDSI